MERESSSSDEHSITVKIFNIRNSKGRIQLQVYLDQKTFADETPWKTYYVSKEDMQNHSVTKKIKGFKDGIYGLALLDDEDADTVMDYGWLMPTEGFGFSNYYHTGWSKPTFHDFKFKLYGDRAINMKIRYL